MFWLAGQIDPELDTITAGFPHVMPLLAKQVNESPEGGGASAQPRA
jgi:hypothetical protein